MIDYQSLEDERVGIMQIWGTTVDGHPAARYRFVVVGDAGHWSSVDQGMVSDAATAEIACGAIGKARGCSAVIWLPGNSIAIA